MAHRYVSIIIDISHENVDRTFRYKIPEELRGKAQVGQQVRIPFGQGNRQHKGYVVDLTDQTRIDVHKLKDMAGVVQGSVVAESQLIWLVRWMKERYGSTMNQALRTVLPVKQKVREVPKRKIRTLVDKGVLKELVEGTGRKKHEAKLRFLDALLQTGTIPYEKTMNRLSLTPLAIKPPLEAGVITVKVVKKYRNPLEEVELLMVNQERKQDVSDEQESGPWGAPPELDPFQWEIADAVIGEYGQGIRRAYLLHGVAESDKTRVYMELIAYMPSAGHQAIVLIPGIFLTWQTIMRFYSHFGNQVSAMNSRIFAGKRYDQYEQTRTGDIDIVIGPRSTLFTPFENLGLIIIDEEHKNAYKSELSPRYDTGEAAAKRAQMNDASLILGSATPPLESYIRALRGEYGLFTLKEGAKEDTCLPRVEIVDLWEKLKKGNRFVFNRRLRALIGEQLEKREQVTLSVNRRGYANSVSCRSCGEAVRYPHCDVTLTLHRDDHMMCHCCGYSVLQPKKCPVCGSPYTAPFGTGTQKIEAMAAELFPRAGILRIDLDTTSKKGKYQEIPSSFVRGEADIFIGTQMIVKGHDFPKVVLVGALAADLSPYASDYRCAEQTFTLLTQAAGRAGRGQLVGGVVIQTYQPDHYSIHTTATQNYVSFYRQEMAYRRLLGYPPAVALLTVQMACPAEGTLTHIADLAAGWVQQQADRMGQEEVQGYKSFQLIGPVNAAVYKVNGIYRKVLYIKHENYDILMRVRKTTEEGLKGSEGRGGLTVQYDLTWRRRLEKGGSSVDKSYGRRSFNEEV